MPACEKCWSDANSGSVAGPVEQYLRYERVLRERRPHPCTPEEQAGPDAGDCPACGRRTLHQHCAVCMACGYDPHPAPKTAEG